MHNASQQIARLGFEFAVSLALRVIIELGIPISWLSASSLWMN